MFGHCICNTGLLDTGADFLLQPCKVRACWALCLYLSSSCGALAFVDSVAAHVGQQKANGVVNLVLKVWRCYAWHWHHSLGITIDMVCCLDDAPFLAGLVG